uniref:RING-type E3 ubiquitin transferase n=2 Tax=Dendroctonus ponderosae TaxID=77166 RepID=A0AAR5PZR5_DENPD
MNFQVLIQTPNSKKMILSDAHEIQISYELMEQSLKCGGCKRFLNVKPIAFDNIMKYAICGRCQPEVRSKHLSPQPLYERLASQFFYPCWYRTEGCEEILALDEVQTHERICRFRAVSCPLSSLELVQQTSCRWTGSAQMINDHIQQHSDLFLDPPMFEWPEIGQNSMFFTKIGHKIVTVAVKYKHKSKFLCLASINDTDLASQCYKYQLELISEDKHSSILLRRDRLRCLLSMSHDFKTPENALQVNLEKLSDMLHNSTKIFARIGIVKKSKKQIQQITGDVISDPPSPANPPQPDDIDEDFLSELECPVCNEFMIAPIFICLTGHSLCNVCKPKIKLCPTCKCHFTKGRNFTLEKLAAKIKYPCTNRTIGCHFVSTSDLIRSHENVCEFSNTDCFYHCGWKLPLADLANHLKNNHRTNEIINNEAFEFCIDETVFNPFSFVVIGRHLFVVVWSCTALSQTAPKDVLFKVYHMSQTASDHVFQYNLQFSLDFNQSCPCMQLSYFCDVWTPEHGIPQKGGQNCLSISGNLLSNYLDQSNQGYMKITISQVAQTDERAFLKSSWSGGSAAALVASSVQ